MGIVTLAVEEANRNAGLTPTFNGSLSVSDTYRVDNDGKVLLYFKKSGAGDCDVTFDTPRQADGLAIADHVVTIPATTGDELLGGFRPLTFNQIGQGYLEFTLDEITGLTVAVFKSK